MVSVRIKALREHSGMTQADLARQMGITRSSVNAWEMGISVPSTQYIVELARLFQISSDYLLGINTSASISVAGLTEKDIRLVHEIVAHLREKTSASSESLRRV